MATIQVLGSSSAGNGYIVEAGGKYLIIEAGIHIDKVLSATGFNLRAIEGCIITHKHGDHYKFHKQYIDAGIKLYASSGTFGELNHHNLTAIKAASTFQVGEFRILPFDIVHDVPEPFGFLINHSEIGTMLFMTDSKYVSHRFKKLNHVFIEVNYDDDKILDKVFDRKLHGSLANRIKENHMSLNDCCSILENQDLKMVDRIVLLHLSSSNADAVKFKNTINSKTGKEILIATPGQVFDISLNPF